MIVPIIHLNGTSPDRLCESLSDAYCAANKLMEALKQCAPNGRDYYPMPGLMEKACEQHRARMQSVTDPALMKSAGPCLAAVLCLAWFAWQEFRNGR